MIVHVEITMQPGEDRHDALARATTAVQRAYRKHANSRRYVSIHRWSEDSYSPGERYSLNRGSIVGRWSRKISSKPVLGEALLTLRVPDGA
jgi:hypothetical protein